MSFNHRLTRAAIDYASNEAVELVNDANYRFYKDAVFLGHPHYTRFQGESLGDYQCFYDEWFLTGLYLQFDIDVNNAVQAMAELADFAHQYTEIVYRNPWTTVEKEQAFFKKVNRFRKVVDEFIDSYRTYSGFLDDKQNAAITTMMDAIYVAEYAVNVVSRGMRPC
jgi:hypothetical protein